MARYIGVDLHRNKFTVCVRTESGRSRLLEWFLMDIAAFKKKLRKDDVVAVESTGNTRFFCDAIKNRVSGIVVVNPRQFKVISQSVKKTDNHDAENLALFLSKGLLPEIRMKDSEQNKISSLVQTRDKLVKFRTSLKNKINNILSAHGIMIPKEGLTSLKALKKIAKKRFNYNFELEVKIIIEQIISLNKSIKKLEDNISKEGKKLEGFENLKSIKGIGDLGGTILLSVIGDVNDFSDEGKLASYFGIVPRVSNSNETERSGRIHKRGSKIGRTTLVQCTLIAIKYSSYLKEFYDRLKKRRGTGKAIIATARKFLGIIYKTLKNKWIFEDFPNYKIAKPSCKRKKLIYKIVKQNVKKQYREIAKPIIT